MIKIRELTIKTKKEGGEEKSDDYAKKVANIAIASPPLSSEESKWCYSK